MAPAVETDELEQSASDKQPIKWMELPIMKFNEVAVPHHVNRLKTLKANIQKCQRTGNWSGAYREQMNANIVIKQLRTLVKEMDVLRSRVIDSDVPKFDKLINNSRQSALNILQEFIDLSHRLSISQKHELCQSNNNGERSDYCYIDDSNGNSYINYDDNSLSDRHMRMDNGQYQLQQTLEISRLNSERQDLEKCAIAWENLQKDIEEVQQLYQELASIVQTQEIHVNQIEENVETAQENVEIGEKTLMKAARLKYASYPLTGALIGSCMGGPVGVVAGFKLGGLVALACSVLGFTGGKLLKVKQDATLSHPHST